MTPRIVVLDGYTLTPAQPGKPPPPGEPAWDELATLGDLTVHDRTPADQVVARARGAHIVLTNKTPITAETLAALTELRYIGVLATGTNVVDLAAARQHHIPVTNVPGYSGASVAQHVFALLLELVSHVAAHDRAVQAGDWSRCDDFMFTLAPLTELADKTLGIVGMGDIGQRVARIGHALGMHIIAYSRTPKALDVPVRWVELDDLFAEADAVTLHCPLTEATHHLVDADRLATMKPSAYLINTGRGQLIDESALAAALREGRLAGAGVDVLSAEPPPADHPLIGAPRCVITPHLAWATREARHRLMRIVTENVRAHLQGKPQNVVNGVA